MSESIPQSNPEAYEGKSYLIPQPDGRVCPGFVTGEREELSVSKQRIGPPVTMRRVQVQYEILSEGGEITIQKMMVSEYLLSDDVQEEIRQRYSKDIQQDV